MAKFYFLLKYSLDEYLKSYVFYFFNFCLVKKIPIDAHYKIPIDAHYKIFEELVPKHSPDGITSTLLDFHCSVKSCLVPRQVEGIETPYILLTGNKHCAHGDDNLPYGLFGPFLLVPF